MVELIKIKKFLEKNFSEGTIDYLRYIYQRFILPSIFKINSKRYLLKKRFKRVFGYDLPLDLPKTFNEKLQWKKLYDKRKIYTICADKYKVRKYVKDKISDKYLVPLLYVTKNPEEIVFGNLPKMFVIKSNHASGQILVVNNKKKFNQKKIIKKLKRWLNINYYYVALEWFYKDITPKILIEKMLINQKGEIPEDYKFYCFSGKVESIQVNTERFISTLKVDFYDPKWNHLDVKLSPHENGKIIPKPKKLRKMIELSEKLSKEFDFVRVDLYEVDGKIYFGELTFSPNSGFKPLFPKEYDYQLGSKLKEKSTLKKSSQKLPIQKNNKLRSILKIKRGI
jgi:hypothetical protein